MKILEWIRLVRYLPALGLVWLAVNFALPHAGVQVETSFAATSLIALSFVVFELVISKALLHVVDIGFAIILSMASDDKQKKNITESILRGLPYPLTLLLFFTRRLITGIIFAVIASALASSYFHLQTSLSALPAGAALALAFWLSPLAVTLLLCLPLITFCLPGLLILMIVSKLPKYKNAKTGDDLAASEKAFFQKLGSMVGMFVALPALSLIFLSEMLPTNPKSIPPEEVPEGLSGEEYYKLGMRYKDAGWIFQSKMALAKAIQLEVNTEIGIKAQRFLDTKLPKNMVPVEATQRNITGFNQMFSGQTKDAIQTFEQLIVEFPDFEWPYNNLASIYIQEKNLERAKSLINQALEINSSYLNAWIHLIEVCELEQDEVGARRALEHAYELDPDDQSLKMKKMTYDNTR